MAVPDNCRSKRSRQYEEAYKTWNPSGFDAEEWMKLFHDNGLRMFAFTTKHHDGFSMFDTKTRVTRCVNWARRGRSKDEPCDRAYSIMETPFGRDVVGELVAAARRHDIKIDFYFSAPDWYDADFRPYVLLADHDARQHDAAGALWPHGRQRADRSSSSRRPIPRTRKRRA